MHVLITPTCIIFLSNAWYFMQCVCMKKFSCICCTWKWTARFDKTWRTKTKDISSVKCTLFSGNLLGFFQMLSYGGFVFCLHHQVKEISNRKDAKCPNNHKELSSLQGGIKLRNDNVSPVSTILRYTKFDWLHTMNKQSWFNLIHIEAKKCNFIITNIYWEEENQEQEFSSIWCAEIF